MCCQNSCSGYHYGWVFLQALGLISGLASEREMIVADIRKAVTDLKIKRILVAGAADFGLLSLLHEALGSECTSKDIVVTDRCATPLKLSEEYANFFGFAIKTCQEDLLALSISPPFDLISVIRFWFFYFGQRHQTLHKLTHCLLRMALFYNQSIRPEKGEVVLSYKQQEIVDMLELAKSRSWQEDTSANARIETIVREFCEAKKTFSVPSSKVVHDHLTNCGLKAESSLLFDSGNTSHKAGTTSSVYEKYAFKGYKPSRQLRQPNN